MDRKDVETKGRHIKEANKEKKSVGGNLLNYPYFHHSILFLQIKQYTIIVAKLVQFLQEIYAHDIMAQKKTEDISYGHITSFTQLLMVKIFTIIYFTLILIIVQMHDLIILMLSL